MSTEKYAYYPNAPLCCRILRPSYTRIKPVPGLPSMRIWTFQSNTTGIAEYSSDQDFCFPDCAACPQPLQLSHADALMRFFWCYFGTSQVQAGSGFRVAGDTPSRHAFVRNGCRLLHPLRSLLSPTTVTSFPLLLHGL